MLVSLDILAAAAAASNAKAEAATHVYDELPDSGTQLLVGPPEQHPEDADAHDAYDPWRTFMATFTP